LSFWVFGPKFFVFLGLGLGLNFGFFGFLGLGLGLGGKPKYQTQNHKIFGCQCLSENHFLNFIDNFLNLMLKKGSGKIYTVVLLDYWTIGF
jgi:hypothetical protein